MYREDIGQIFPRCRDREEVTVWRCHRSGVISLCSAAQITERYYKHGDTQNYYQMPSRDAAIRLCAEDDKRRLEEIRQLAGNAVWIDVGTGVGGFLDHLVLQCAGAVGIEPQEGLRDLAMEAGHDVLAAVAEAKKDYLDVASLLDVFELLPNLLDAL